MDNPEDVIVIGELSAVKILLAWAAITLLLALLLVLAAVRLKAGLLVGAMFVVAMWAMSSRLALLVLRGGRRGLYVRRGVLHEAVCGDSAALENIRAAYRGSPRGGWFKTAVLIEAGGAKPLNAAYPDYIQLRSLGGSALIYDTPAAVMLERLEACGVKIRGSKTAVL